MRVMLATSPGTPGWPNEDYAAVSPGAAVLLDGATTSPPGGDTGCAHGVAWFARTLGTTLLAAITAVPHRTLADALATAISDVRALHQHTCDLAHPSTPAATVTAVRADPGGISYLALADSTIAARYRDHRPPLIITDTHPAARATPKAAHRATTGLLPRHDLDGIALLSDGAARITDHYQLMDWPDVLALASGHGPGELLRQLRAAEQADPDGARWPRRKASDDATIIYWHHD
jgi:hypothetical protein